MNKKYSRLGTALFSLLLLGLSLWAITHQLKAHDYRDIVNSLRGLSGDRLLLALVLTGLDYGTMTGYDALALRYINHPLPYSQSALAAFISITFSNTIGLAWLTGSAIRYRLYSAWGLSIVEIAQVVAFANLSFWVGMLAVGGVLFFIEPIAIPDLLNLPFNSIKFIGAIFLALGFGYLILSILIPQKALRLDKFVLKIPAFGLACSQIAVSTLDWALAAGVLYVLLNAPALSYPAFFGFYLLAQLAGIISNVPGGLGVFETIIVLLLSPTVSADVALASLLAYRGIYYFLPLGVAATLLVWQEYRRHS